MSARIAVIGAGAWGTALAQAATLAGNAVTLIARDPAVADAINAGHRNPRFLSDIALADTLAAETGWAAVAEADLVLLVVPAQASRETLGRIDPAALADKPVVLCAKGFETGTNRLQSQILAEMVPGARPFVLSGPSFAWDVAAGRPTAVTLAGHAIEDAETIAAILHSPYFRPYASDDVAGVELAGGLKNVYALACGAVEGAGLGLSSRSAVLARAFAEMGRLVVAMGGAQTTLGGLAGIGDLALSCTSPTSRNYSFGMALGAGRTVEAIRAGGAGLAEGVHTAPVALALARRFAIDAPLVEAVNLLMAGEMTIDGIVAQLMARPLKREGRN